VDVRIPSPIPATVVACALAGASVALASPARAATSPAGIVIHDAATTLRERCVVDEAGVTWLVLPDGTRYELVTAVDDPVIVNPGDGAFFPFDHAEVEAALAEVRYPLGTIEAEVFILPFPRRDGLESAAGPGLILLSPGVRPIARETQHAEFVHELGHVVQRRLMPESDGGAWSAYRRLRGIEDGGLYSELARHADRPREIFAEDFRALFGGPLARRDGAVENQAIAGPASVAGLESFMLGLAGGAVPALALAAVPNPTAGAVAFTRPGTRGAPLDLYDLGGRRVASLRGETMAGGTRWSWDGASADGRRAGPGVYFARVREARAATLRVTVTR
jgi:hypothetical protein